MKIGDTERKGEQINRRNHEGGGDRLALEKKSKTAEGTYVQIHVSRQARIKKAHGKPIRQRGK